MTAAPSPPHRLPRVVRVGVYLLVNLLLLAVLLELGVRLIYPRMLGPEFSWTEVRARLNGGAPDALIANDPRVGGQTAAAIMLHPYLGYVFTPGSAASTRGDEQLHYSSLGFFGDEPVMRKSDDEAVVVLGGGSVAAGLWGRAGDAIRTALQADPAFAGKKIRLESFALGGFKQPQLVHTLVHLLSLGAHIDVWIELDGFNEIALPLAENAPAGVPVIYPRNWERLSKTGISATELAARAAIFTAQQQREQRRAAVSRGPWRRSAFFVSCWNELDRRDADHIAELVQSLGKESKQSAKVADDAVLRESVAVWKSASEQMAKICAANGIRYFQFIQPNQYFPGTKTFSEEETRTALAHGGYQPPAEKGYPLLVAAGEELRAEGVPIVDLTMIFKGEPRTVYRDTCCHLNQLGNELLAQQIAVAVLDAYSGSSR